MSRRLEGRKAHKSRDTQQGANPFRRTERTITGLSVFPRQTQLSATQLSLHHTRMPMKIRTTDLAIVRALMIICGKKSAQYDLEMLDSCTNVRGQGENKEGRLVRGTREPDGGGS